MDRETKSNIFTQLPELFCSYALEVAKTEKRNHLPNNLEHAASHVPGRGKVPSENVGQHIPRQQGPR